MAMNSRVAAGLLAAALLALPIAAPGEARADGAAAKAHTPLEMTKLQKKKATFSEKWGRALFGEYEKVGKVSNMIMDRALATATSAVTDRCDVRYRALLVIPPRISTDRLAVYYIGDIQNPEGIMIGRHYRVIVSGDGRTAQSVTPSTKECTFVLPQDIGDGVSGIVLSDPDAVVPSDIQVFLSLVIGETILVDTNTERWRVRKGRIDLLEVD